MLFIYFQVFFLPYLKLQDTNVTKCSVLSLFIFPSNNKREIKKSTSFTKQIFRLKFGLVNAIQDNYSRIKTYVECRNFLTLIEFTVPNLSQIYLCLPETFKTNF